MATPICTHVGKFLEAMRNAVVDLLLVRIRFRVGLADTLRNHTGIALCVAGIFAIFALHTGRVLEEIAAQSTPHDVVELLLHKLVAVHLMNLFLALANGALSVEADIEGSSVFCLLCEADSEVHCASGLERKPRVNGLRGLSNRGIHTKTTSAARAKSNSLGRCAELCWLWAGKLLRG